MHVLGDVVEEFLDGDGVAILKGAFVYSTRTPPPNHKLLAQIVRQPHHLLEWLWRHPQVKSHQTRRPCSCEEVLVRHNQTCNSSYPSQRFLNRVSWFTGSCMSSSCINLSLRLSSKSTTMAHHTYVQEVSAAHHKNIYAALFDSVGAALKGRW